MLLSSRCEAVSLTLPDDRCYSEPLQHAIEHSEKHFLRSLQGIPSVSALALHNQASSTYSCQLPRANRLILLILPYEKLDTISAYWVIVWWYLRDTGFGLVGEGARLALQVRASRHRQGCTLRNQRSCCLQILSPPLLIPTSHRTTYVGIGINQMCLGHLALVHARGAATVRIWAVVVTAQTEHW